MQRILILLIMYLFTSHNVLWAGEIRDSAMSMIKNKFEVDSKVITYKLNLSKNLKLKSEKYAKQRFYGNFVFYYEIIKNNEIEGYAILDNVLGKVKPITYLVLFNKDLSIASVNIIKYREQYGGAIENKEWLDQFKLKNMTSELELNTDIDGISGATISVKSVIKGVKKLLFLINNMDTNEKDLLVSAE